ncbi:OPT oligopeptide transporter protein-domain-containing protein [Lactarius quietus]|nr:OPT oligopeptide transporter protein-domain-containing protein [Lactarius quietus]
MFFCQAIATVIAGTVQLGVQAWLCSNVEEFVAPPKKTDLFALQPRHSAMNRSSSVISSLNDTSLFPMSPSQSGVIGLHPSIIQWAFYKRFKVGLLRYLNFPIVFSSMTLIPPATPINFVPLVLLCFLSNFVIRRRHFVWWTKFNYSWRSEMIILLSGALDAGYTFGVIFIFFTFQYPDNGKIALNSIQNWWGNTVFLNTADANGTPLKTLSDGQTFEPKSW